MRGDGNGWAVGPDGARYWGVFGAAGLLVTAPTESGPAVLLQHRALWSHQGGTWAIPGGARDSHETAAEAALREAQEETGLEPAAVRVVDEVVTLTVAGGWSYTTVLATAARTHDLVSNAESEEIRWVPVETVDSMPLLAPFRSVWPDLYRRLSIPQ